MRCYEIFCVEELERRAMARDLMRGRDQITRRVGKTRRVQHLADMASCLRSLGVMVQESDARHDIKQRNAAENRESLARVGRGKEPGL